MLIAFRRWLKRRFGFDVTDGERPDFEKGFVLGGQIVCSPLQFNPFMSNLDERTTVSATEGVYQMQEDDYSITVANPGSYNSVLVKLPPLEDATPGRIYSVYLGEGNGDFFLATSENPQFAPSVPSASYCNFIVSNGTAWSWLNDWETWATLGLVLRLVIGSLEVPEEGHDVISRLASLESRVDALES